MKFECMIGILRILGDIALVIFAFFTTYNAIKTRKLNQENVKILVLPEIKKIVLALRSFKIDFSDFEKQTENIQELNKSLTEIPFYFKSSDKVVKNLEEMFEKLWRMNDLLGERDSMIQVKRFKEDRGRYNQLSHDIGVLSKELNKIVNDTIKTILERYQVVSDTFSNKQEE